MLPEGLSYQQMGRRALVRAGEDDAPAMPAGPKPRPEGGYTAMEPVAAQPSK